MTLKKSSSGWGNFLVGLSSVALAVSCAGDDPLTQGEFCDQKAAMECDGVAANCSATPAACKADRVTACMDFVQLQVPVASRPFRPDRAQACLDATRTTYTKSRITPADRQVMNDACERVFSGSKMMLASCVSNYECDGNLICDQGVCATRNVVGQGAFCANPGDVCPGGQRCIQTGATRACMTPSIPVGAACDDDTNPCGSELRCVAGTCTAKVEAEGACQRDSDCASTVPYCDPYYNNTCDTGFIPSRSSLECVDFGATLASP